MAIPKFGIQHQPFTQNIEVGRLNKAGDRFIGEKEDCTGMVLSTVAKHVSRRHGGVFEKVLADGSKLTIKVEKPGIPNG